MINNPVNSDRVECAFIQLCFQLYLYPSGSSGR